MAKKNSTQTGIILLIVGIGLLVWGINIYGAFGSKLTRALGGAPAGRTMLILAGGAVCTCLGLYRIIKK